MCGSKAPKTVIPQEPPKAKEPVAPLVTAAEVDDEEANRKKGIKSLKVETSKTQSGSGLNIP